jgi:hypothetical protein
VGGRVFGLLDPAGDAEPVGTAPESGADVAIPRVLDLKLVQGQRLVLQRGRRGTEQQDSSGDQTSLRISDLQSDGNGFVSHVRTTPRTR